MRILIRKVALGTASVLALAIGGVALDYAAVPGNAATTGSMPFASQTSESWPGGDSFRTDDIRWAQVELRNRGLYKGSLDGILGPETKRALEQFQQKNGLGRTASLDAQTWEALTGNPGVGLGSSTPLNTDRDESTTNSFGKSDSGR
jgi:peptidoglycan hydrolase-like protein with peptidoglycan-binding domain